MHLLVNAIPCNRNLGPKTNFLVVVEFQFVRTLSTNHPQLMRQTFAWHQIQYVWLTSVSPFKSIRSWWLKPVTLQAARGCRRYLPGSFITDAFEWRGCRSCAVSVPTTEGSVISGELKDRPSSNHFCGFMDDFQLAYPTKRSTRCGLGFVHAFWCIEDQWSANLVTATTDKEMQ